MNWSTSYSPIDVDAFVKIIILPLPMECLNMAAVTVPLLAEAGWQGRLLKKWSSSIIGAA
ncbi:MAG: hypothetical protein GXO68_02735 [Crenarchaeota archaeon]|nr:hypothetical protein [Thermoproteota archaeon]